ncbi:hypothetical protein L1049_012770 [Liquidambar formosana]|uniref:RING-type E3 ubiquitin transferase n=1 Tax=Liquidambar formosana TaxID=63359 RepID=A0AAP0RLT6_LIQFO
MSVTHVLGPSRFHNFHNFTLDTTLCDSPTKGLDSSIISSIPIFVYDKEKFGLECVICLSVFEENEIGRNLPKCGHAFHVECIDMWLNSHSNCPICRAPVVCDKKVGQVAVVNALGDGVVLQEGSGELSEMVAGDVGSVGDAVLEIIIEGPGSENVAMNDSLSASSSSLSSSPVGCSLKRMMSRNRSERKVFPSSNANELDA